MKSQDNAALYRYMIEGSRDVVFLLDKQGRFAYLNDRIKPLLGYQKQDLLGEHFSSLLHPDDLNKSERAYAQCINRSCGPATRGIQLRVRHKAGTDNFRYFDIKLTTVPENISEAFVDGNHNPGDGNQRVAIYGAARDITQLKSLERIIKTNTNYDYLTGLPNRVLLKDRIKLAVARAKRDGRKFAVMFIDLDGFKQVNDRFGHSAGDILLQAVSERLAACLREVDTLARVGGDEFVLLLPDVRVRNEISTIAAKLLAEINNPFVFNNYRVSLSASIGIALFPEEGDGFESLINAADNAMYYIKHQKKNGFVFLSDMPLSRQRENVFSPLAQR